MGDDRRSFGDIDHIHIGPVTHPSTDIAHLQHISRLDVVIGLMGKVSGTTPKFTRLSWWMRAKDLVRMALTPRYIGHIAACSRELP